MSETRMAPHDWFDPCWECAAPVHDWRNYASGWLREVWPAMGDEVKRAVAASLDDIASREEWE